MGAGAVELRRQQEMEGPARALPRGNMQRGGAGASEDGGELTEIQ
jgi:hypothetical protein